MPIKLKLSLCVLNLVLCATAPARVKTGLDVMVEQDFAPLAGKRVGVVTNHTGLTWDHRHIVQVLAASKNCKLTAVFSPEHGYLGIAADGAYVDSGKDPATGVPVYSLFRRGSSKPAPEMLKNVDALIFDIQDVGARFYTYPTTLAYVLEAAGKQKIPVYVLDRPNPVNGVAAQGPLLDSKYASFIGYFREPIRHGMTIGELAGMFNVENKLGAELHVVKMVGWDRKMWMDETGLAWSNPSPAIRNLTEATLYTGTCLLENTVVSIGRGTDTPFEILGAPWFKGLEVADYLNARQIPGVRFMARRFRPSDDVYKGQDCDGLDVQLINRDALDTGRLGLELLAAALKLHPGKFTLDKKIMLLLGSDRAAELLNRGQTGAQVNDSLRDELAAFRKMRAKYLMY
jgi:uncharacterized protein YbbC (DUF1343 family)